MPKPQATSQVLRAYSRKQRTGLISGRRSPIGRPPEPPISALIGSLVEMATLWLTRHDPDAQAEQRNREAMAMVGDFLSLAHRGPIPHHAYRGQFRDYLDGAAVPTADPGEQPHQD